MKNYAFLTLLLMGCGSEQPDELPAIDLFEGGNLEQPAHPNKQRLGGAPHCENWRESLAAEISAQAPWGLPQTGIVSENINGFFATQFPIGGLDYSGCVLADIFDEIPLHAEVLRETYFALPPEAQSSRSDLALFLGYLYEEPLIVPLLLDIAIQPPPDFSPDFIESLGWTSIKELESAVRVSAVLAISQTAPYAGDRQLWIDALFDVVENAEPDRGTALIATWELKRNGVTRSEFEQRMESRLSDDDFTYLSEHGWP